MTARKIQRELYYLKLLRIFQTDRLFFKPGYLYHAIDPKSKILVRDATQVFSYLLLADMKVLYSLHPDTIY